MPGINFEQVRNEITMAQVLNLIGFELTSRCGDQLRGACPVHGSKTARSRSFSVSLRDHRYYCHKCHSKGHQIELWAAVNKLSLYNAAIDLCRCVGRDVPWVQRW
jgi:DNA primase